MRALIVFVVLFTTCFAVAQPVPDAPQAPDGQIVALESGQRAPWAGLLIEQDDLARWRLTIDSLRFELRSERELSAARREVEIDLGRQRTLAAEQMLMVHEELWRGRVGQLSSSVLDLQRQLTEEQRGHWYDSPLLWFGLGIAVTVVIVVGAAITL